MKRTIIQVWQWFILYLLHRCNSFVALAIVLVPAWLFVFLVVWYLLPNVVHSWDVAVEFWYGSD